MGITLINVNHEKILNSGINFLTGTLWVWP